MPLHDLRHTAASLAVSVGANVKSVQRMLGHASAAMTLDIYADLFDADLYAVATLLNQAATFSSVAKVLPREDFGQEKPPHPLKTLGYRGPYSAETVGFEL
ncbi:integrase [Cryobacterium sp. MDB1-18-2]|nr:integrase [Cryobacterium sp. MDB1-18-2]TFC40769.1 integrase [Cryobacterium sp. MDB1-18-1]